LMMALKYSPLMADLFFDHFVEVNRLVLLTTILPMSGKW
jgi:hypothetical protein